MKKIKIIAFGALFDTHMLDVFHPLGRLSDAIDTKHRYKAPHANRAGAQPFKRKDHNAGR